METSKDGPGCAPDLRRLAQDHVREGVVIDSPEVLVPLEPERSAFQVDTCDGPLRQRITDGPRRRGRQFRCPSLQVVLRECGDGYSPGSLHL